MPNPIQWTHTLLPIAAIAAGCVSAPHQAWQQVLADCQDVPEARIEGMVYVGPSDPRIGVGSLWREAAGRLELVMPAPQALPSEAVQIQETAMCDHATVRMTGMTAPGELALSRLAAPEDLAAALDAATRADITIDQWRRVALRGQRYDAWFASLMPDDPYRQARAEAGVRVVWHAIEVDGMHASLRLDGGRAAEIVASFGTDISSSQLLDVGVPLGLELSDWDTLELTGQAPMVIAVESVSGDSSFDAAVGVADPHRQAQTVPFSFATEAGHFFDGRIHLPAEEDRNGYGVLMIGGGLGNDLDWTVPDHLEINGVQSQITITGEPHADAPLIAKALTDRGFVVAHWSTIRRDDPNANWPYTMTTYPLPQTVLHAKGALSAFQARQFHDADRTILLGYSMGGQRACILAQDDPDIAGLVLLAPAQLTRTGPNDTGKGTDRADSVVLLVAMDQDGNDTVSRDEYAAWRASGDKSRVLSGSFDTIDFDKDQVVRLWELAGARARDRRSAIDPHAVTVDGFGLPWSEDLLRYHPVPTLVLYGALDNAQGQHAPVMFDLIQTQDLQHVTLQVLPGIGHAMGPEEQGRIGPIDDVVLERVGRWLGQTTGYVADPGDARRTSPEGD